LVVRVIVGFCVARGDHDKCSLWFGFQRVSNKCARDKHETVVEKCAGRQLQLKSVFNSSRLDMLHRGDRSELSQFLFSDF